MSDYVVQSAEWFVMITLPVPTQFNDSAHRFEVEWKNARKQLSDRWSDAEIFVVPNFAAMSGPVAAMFRW